MKMIMNEQEVADCIGYSVHWLRRKRWEGGGIPFFKMPGGGVRYRFSDVEQFIADHIRKSTSDGKQAVNGEV